MLLVSALAFGGPVEDWEAWVRGGHPEWACVASASAPMCAWPGTFSLDAGAGGARFVLGVRLDRDGDVPLPGGREAWPEGVRAGGRDVVVLDRAGVPTAVLPAGAWQLEGSYAWASLPQGLTLPGDIGLVRLRVAGDEVPAPRIDGGVLRLGAGDAPGESRLELDVLRRVVDGVPAVVETRVQVRAAGASREVDLGKVLLDHTRAVALHGELPARLGPDGDLVLQARPGTWTVQVDATVQGPLTALTMPTLPEPWPTDEFWAVALDETVRAVTLSGPPGVDPGRTPLADDWKGLPTYRLNPGGTLTFTELRRGQPSPPQNALRLTRELWVDFDRDGLTARDRFAGEMNQGWRLDLATPGVLGHATVDNEDEVVTLGPTGATGVEVRSQQVAVAAESRVEGVGGLLGVGSLPAVGWQTRVQALATTLHLPEGSVLVWAPGADHAPGSLVERWDLLDVLFCALVGLLSHRLGGWRVAAAAVVGAGLTRQIGWMPGWAWVVLLALANTAPVLKGKGRVLLVVGAGLVCAAVPFTLVEEAVRTAPSFSSDDEYGSGAYEEQGMRQSLGKGDLKSRNISVQKDANEVVQTGPGVPNWQGETTQLTWDGPVAADQPLLLVYLGPWTAEALGVLGLGLVLASGWGVGRGMLRRAGAAALVFVLIVPVARAEEPTPPAEPWVVTALTERLAPTPCGTCVDVPRVAVRVDGASLRLLATVDASAPAAWPLPGPATSWMPTTVTVDGAAAVAMKRRDDGFVLLRLDPGVHHLELSGPVDGGGVALQFDTAPKRIDVDAPGWSVDGVRPDGSAEATLSLAHAASGGSVAELSPRIEVHRFLDLGFPWRIRTTVSRVGTGDRPVSLKVPLLAGEAVTDDGFVVKDGAVAISLGATGSVEWLSTLAPVDTLTLTAPRDVPWTELWEVSCSPVYACATEGLPALSYVQEGSASPQFRPWPGETMTVHVTRREAAEGQVLTVDSAVLRWTPGPRLTEGELRLHVRSAQGGALPVTFPAGTEVTRVTVGGSTRPMEAKDGVLALPLQPGAQELVVEVQVPWTMAAGATLPPVTVGAAAVNLKTSVVSAPGRWVFAAWGPGEGPGPGFPGRLGLLALAAGVAARFVRGLRLRDWLGVALGCAVLPTPVFVALALGLAVLLHADAAQRRFGYPLGNVVLAGAFAGVAALVCAVVVVGLTGQPPRADGLAWFVDRSAGALPSPTVVALPVWAWRVGVVLAAGLVVALGVPRRVRAALRWEARPKPVPPPVAAE